VTVVSEENLAKRRKPDETLRRLFELHRRWNEGVEGGERLEAVELDLSDMNLEGLNLSGAIFLRVTFDRSDLRGVDLYRANVADSSMLNVDLRNADLVKAEFTATALRGASLQRAQLDGLEAREVDLREADLTGAKGLRLGCWRSDLRWATLQDLRLDCTILKDCRMSGADLSGSCGTIARQSRIHVGPEESPELLEGDAMLEWMRRAGATTVQWCEHEPRPPGSPLE